MVELKKYWRPLFKKPIVVAIVFGIFFAAIRFFGVVIVPNTRWVLPTGFLVMILMPFVFLTRPSWPVVGFRKAGSIRYYFWGFLLGAGMAFLTYLIGWWLFEAGGDNWFVTIKNNYKNILPFGNPPGMGVFIALTVPAILFSPFGEEIYFRGFLQESLENILPNKKLPLLLDAGFFAIIHICHHGILLKDGKWIFYPWSGLIWVALMFLTAFGFALLKQKSKSLYPVILSHQAFNLVMNLCILYLLP